MTEEEKRIPKKKVEKQEQKPQHKINKYGFFGTTKGIREALKIPKGVDYPVEVKLDKKARSITLTIIGEAS